MLLSTTQMLSHINFSLSLRLTLFLRSIFLRAYLDITTLFIIKLSKPNIFPLLHFLHIFIQFQNLLLVLVGAIINDILNVILDDKGLALQDFIQHHLETSKLF